MAKATFVLADEADPFSSRITVAIDVDADVPDEWWQKLQDHIATNLPPGITWASVHRYSLQIQANREVDPLPQP